MNSYTALLVAHSHAADLVAEPDRERLARQAKGARRAVSGPTGRPATTRWNPFTLRRSPAGSR